jgi:two-component system, chemotaxis family, chemotaxis protein CheY
MKIVVADDSRVMRQIVIRSMRRAGHTDHTYLEAVDGDAAFELVRAESPELVLSDWNMPGTSGLDLLRRLRACGEKVTFGFVTSETSHDMRRQAYDAGAAFLIGKPFGPDDFREVLGPAVSQEETRATVTALPSAKAVRNLLETLLGRDVAVTPSAPVEVGPLDPAHVAVYVDDRTRMAATAVADLSLAVRCGAALGLTPRRVADEAVRSRELPALLRADVDEILNVVSTLFNQAGAPHVRLHSTFGPGERLPGDVDSVVHTLGRRLDLHVDVAAYGAGRLGLVLAP